MNTEIMNIEECFNALFALSENTALYWDDKAGEELRDSVKRIEKEINSVLNEVRNEKH